MGTPEPGRPIINRDAAIKRMYYIWNQMIARCYHPRCKSFSNYGGRGITVCEEWRASFWRFYDDMTPRPAGRSMLDRIDNDGGYSKENCRWVYADQSNANRRWCIQVDGVTLKQYMRANGRLGEYRMVAKRIKKGMPVAKALSTPSRACAGRARA